MARGKNGRKGGAFAAIPIAILESSEYAQLTPRGVKLLLDLLAQFKGANNGDLSAAFTTMKPRGWKSKDQLEKALDELVEKKWIVQTRQGGRGLCSLYAVTWKKIDECGGKLDAKPTAAPMNIWRTPAPVIQLEVPKRILAAVQS